MLSITKHVPKIVGKSKKMNFLLSQNIKVINKLSTKTCLIEEKKVNINGIGINYVRAGIGEHVVLLLPGILGSIWTDFKPQIENLNKKQFTIIAWDPPGYGKSRPPDKTFPENYHIGDATCAHNLMKALDFHKFSLIGWSDGGHTALILAAMYPKSIEKLITIGSRSYITPGEMETYEKMRNLNTWSERIRKPLVDMYGEKYFQDILDRWVDTARFTFENNKGDVCNQYLNKIECPSLIVHGEKDLVAARDHAYYLQVNIKNSKVQMFKDGAHNLHLRYPDKFNGLIEKFLLQQEDSEL